MPGEAKVATAAIAPAAKGPLIEPPADLAPEAQQMFARVVAELAPRGLREADVEAVAMMCHSAYIHLLTQIKIASSSEIVKISLVPI